LEVVLRRKYLKKKLEFTRDQSPVARPVSTRASNTPRVRKSVPKEFAVRVKLAIGRSVSVKKIATQ
jgi:hypothetical protein